MTAKTSNAGARRRQQSVDMQASRAELKRKCPRLSALLYPAILVLRSRGTPDWRIADFYVTTTRAIRRALGPPPKLQLDKSACASSVVTK